MQSHRLLLATGLFLTTVIATITQSTLVAGSPSNQAKKPTTPKFATNYHVKGVLSLPYAELNEPFSAWYDKNTSRSRTVYYDNLYSIYQFGPKSAPSVEDREFGVMYKLVYVPSNFDTQVNSGLIGIVGKKIAQVESKINIPSWFKNVDNNKRDAKKTATKQACFSVRGSVGDTISPQTVLPNMDNFEFDSFGKCPHVSFDYRHKNCELWKMTTNVGDKKNTYKMWIYRHPVDNHVVPVHYYMLGFDSLLGSHYDRYDITYRNYLTDVADDSAFEFDVQSRRCGSMPGPGSDSSDGAKRSHLIVQNPIHEYVIEPHRYDHVDHEFDKFKLDHNKEYEGDEHHRKKWFNFMHNSRFINGKNRQLKQYKLGVNQFADESVDDLRYLRGRLHSKPVGGNGGLDYGKVHKLRGANGELKVPLPETYDWTLLGAVSPVKDQAVCGSCWSFGTTGALEGAYFVKNGKLPILSQQQLVDCSWKYGNNGCDGGEDFRAYQYIMDAGGLATMEDYGDYLGVDGICHEGDVEKKVKISGFYNVTSRDQAALQHAILTYGPATVAIDASRPTFTFYSHGVYYDDKCNNASDGLDHQVLVTGFTKIDGKFVWIVKNSWSTYWGNNGFIMMSSENNNCGVMDMPTIPIISN